MFQTRQSTHSVLMVKPQAFFLNEECDDNQFTDWSATGLSQAKAAAEWQSLHGLLLQEGVEVYAFTNPDASCPDAHFPNNWFSTHRKDNEAILSLFPMRAPSRQRERRPEIIDFLKSRYATTLDFRQAETGSVALEGTGSLVLDHLYRRAYMALSLRSDLEVGENWANAAGYTLYPFDGKNSSSQSSVYHTNVLMSLGTSFAVVHAARADSVLGSLRKERELIEIDERQMENFCGNVLEIRNRNDDRLLAMSSRAYSNFSPAQIETLSRHVDRIVHVDISTIEKLGGGSVRCMLAELF